MVVLFVDHAPRVDLRGGLLAGRDGVRLPRARARLPRVGSVRADIVAVREVVHVLRPARRLVPAAGAGSAASRCVDGVDDSGSENGAVGSEIRWRRYTMAMRHPQTVI